MVNITVLGYFGRHNLGDDIFSWLWPKILKDVVSTIPNFNNTVNNIQVLDIDDIQEFDKNTDIIILGGGDVINDYFIHKLERIRQNSTHLNKSIAIYAISVGIPYPKLIEAGYLDGFDLILHRNLIDDMTLQTRYGEDRSFWFPDLSILLEKYLDDSISNSDDPILPKRNKQKNVGIFLARTLRYPNDVGAYQTVLAGMIDLIKHIASQEILSLNGCSRNSIKKYQIYLIPFSTDDNPNQDDRLINRDIYNSLNPLYDNIHLMDAAIEIEELLPLFHNLDYAVCTRYHAHMISFITNTPFLSIYCSRKVDNLITELDMQEWSYKMEVDPYYLYPVELNSDILIHRWNKLVEDKDVVKDRLKTVKKQYVEKSEEMLTVLRNAIFYSFQSPLVTDKIDREALQLSIKVLEHISQKYLGYLTIDCIDQVVKQSGYLHLILEEKLGDKNHQLVNQLASAISYIITGIPYTEYNWGIQENILSPYYNLFEAVKWIMIDYSTKTSSYHLLTNKIPLEDRLLNTRSINNNFLEGFHRSGWSWVTKGLDLLHTSNGIMLDSYCDKTFGWDSQFLADMDIIPYTKPWIGILHHTFDKNYSDYNLHNICDNIYFQQSLSQCKALIVFSNANAKILRQKLLDISPVVIYYPDDIVFVEDIPILSLYHPTEIVTDDNLWHWTNWRYNEDKKLIQIGAWLRDTYAIWKLGEVRDDIRRVALKGKEMDNYYLSDEEYEDLVERIKTLPSDAEVERYSAGTICRVEKESTNKWVKGYLSSFIDDYSKVDILDRVSDQEYDKLLANNIIFINLVDASAVNTVLECIARATPIICNRLPALEQYLGPRYPLFYNDLSEVEELCSDRILRRAHKYLKRLDKTHLLRESLLKELIRVTKTL